MVCDTFLLRISKHLQSPIFRDRLAARTISQSLFITWTISAETMVVFQVRFYQVYFRAHLQHTTIQICLFANIYLKDWHGLNLHTQHEKVNWFRKNETKAQWNTSKLASHSWSYSEVKPSKTIHKSLMLN